MRFSDRLRQLRLARGMSLATLAARAGTGRGYLSGVENGKVAPPSARLVRALARVLRHDRRDLLTLAYVAKAPREIRARLEGMLARGKPGRPCRS